MVGYGVLPGAVCGAYVVVVALENNSTPWLSCYAGSVTCESLVL